MADIADGDAHPDPERPRGGQGKKLESYGSAALLALFIGGLLFALSPWKDGGNSAESSSHSSSSSNGIGVSRAEVIHAMGSDFDFIDGAPVNGEPQVIADYRGAKVQLVGPKDDLTQATIEVSFDPKGSNVDELGMKIGTFIGSVEYEAASWVAQTMRSKGETASWEDSTQVDGKTIRLQSVVGEQFLVLKLIVTR